jgi:hypothetical protein
METKTTGRSKRQTSQDFKEMCILTVAGGAAFWVADFAISVSPIASEYKAAFSISYLPLALVEAFVGGLIIAALVSYSFLRFFDKIPTKSPILKSVILSFIALLIVETLSTLVNPSNAFVYFLIATAMNMPRFLILGAVVGYAYTRLDTRTITQTTSRVRQSDWTIQRVVLFSFQTVSWMVCP